MTWFIYHILLWYSITKFEFFIFESHQNEYLSFSFSFHKSHDRRHYAVVCGVRRPSRAWWRRSDQPRVAVVGKTEPNHLPDGSTQLPVAENSLRSSSYRPSSLSSLIVIASDNLLLRKALSQLMLIANIYSP